MPKVPTNFPRLFPQDDLAAKRHARLRLPPPIPENGWTPPKEPPNLSAAIVIGYDTETYDPNLDDNGPGWATNDGHIVGVSLAAKDRQGNAGSWYFPLRHEVEGHLNIAPEPFFNWLRPILGNSVPKIGANITYDVGWSTTELCPIGGPLNDIQFAEPLIDSEARVALEDQGQKYLGRGKFDNELIKWQRQAYPNTPETKRRKDIYRSPPQLVGPYAEDDALMPIEIFEKQWPILQAEGTDYVYRLECDLIPMMIAMRQAGLRVDVKKATKLFDELTIEIDILYQRIYHEYGVNIRSTKASVVGPLLESVGLEIPRTDANAFSVEKEWLAGLHHPLADILNEIREREKICGTFLKSYIIDRNHNGFLYPSFHQLKGDENGTIVGRFASSGPNLQNIPSRTDLGKRVRECFVPDEGHSHWRKHDYSQIHYRLLANVAVDDGDGSADRLRARYNDDPNTDYHKDVYYNVAPRIGWSITDEGVIKQKRRIIKNVNFSLLYGVSKKAMQYKYLSDMTAREVEDFFKNYYEGAPYIKPTMKAIAGEVQTYGYVTTLLGRRIRFHEWEPIRYDDKEGFTLKFDAALRHWGPSIKRAFEYRGVNYKFQGSEPDIMKHGMRDLWRSGVLDFIGVPRITVHDELDWSVRERSPAMHEAFEFARRTMENTLKLRVPVKVDATEGEAWGKAD